MGEHGCINEKWAFLFWRADARLKCRRSCSWRTFILKMWQERTCWMCNEKRAWLGWEESCRCTILFLTLYRCSYWGEKMSGDDEQQEQTVADDLVVTKYKMGADIANRKFEIWELLSVVDEALASRHWTGCILNYSIFPFISALHVPWTCSPDMAWYHLYVGFYLVLG